MSSLNIIFVKTNTGDDIMNEALENFRQQLIDNWNRHDEELRNDFLKFEKDHEEQRFELFGRKVSVGGYYSFINHLNKHDTYVMYYGATPTSKAENEKEATKYVMNLQERVEKITGEILDIQKKPTENGDGWYVRGLKGNAEVLNIFAGGYNIVKLHVRSLVKKVK